MPGELFTTRPWTAPPPDLTPEPIPKGFLFEREAHLLYYLARDWVDGRGTVVDAGAFLGRSAHFLAHGLAENPRAGSTRVHCFDNFLVNDEHTRDSVYSFFGEALAIGDSTRPIFDRQVAGIAERLDVHEADFVTYEWSKEPIEILLVDIAKTVPLHANVLRSFFDCLIPGHSIVVHQDYHHPWLPHIHVVMEYLADWFEIVEAKADSSIAFLNTKAIPAERIETAARYEFAADERRRLMDAAIARLPEDRRYAVLLARTVMLQADGDLPEARRTLDEAACATPEVGDPNRDGDLSSVTNFLLEHEGWAAFESGDYEGALGAARARLARPGATGSSALLEAMSLIELGRHAAAAAALDRSVAAYHEDGQLLLHRARLELYREDYREAERRALACLESFGHDHALAGHCLLACYQAWGATGAWERGRDVLAKLCSEHPRTPAVWIATAEVAAQLGETARAAAAQARAREVGPHDEWVLRFSSG